MKKNTLLQTNIAMANGPFIVDLPIQNGDVPSFFVCLPEGMRFHHRLFEESHPD